jgi:hypothetical protein
VHISFRGSYAPIPRLLRVEHVPENSCIIASMLVATKTQRIRGIEVRFDSHSYSYPLQNRGNAAVAMGMRTRASQL